MANQETLPIDPLSQGDCENTHRIFNNELVEETLELLTQAHRFPSVEAWGEFMVEALPQNSGIVRRRNARYIQNRFAPNGQFFLPLVEFAQKFAGTPALRQVVYYHFCLAERLLGDLVAQVLWPYLPVGSVPLSEISDFLNRVHPLEKSGRRSRNNCVRTLRNFGLVTSPKGADPVTFAAPAPELPAFVYILHHATQAPSMRHYSALTDSWAAQVMLWPASALPSLLREALHAGWLAKISEIDGRRQFTTRWTLEEVVERWP